MPITRWLILGVTLGQDSWFVDSSLSGQTESPRAIVSSSIQGGMVYGNTMRSHLCWGPWPSEKEAIRSRGGFQVITNSHTLRPVIDSNMNSQGIPTMH